MSTLKSLQQQVVSFRDARDWKQFHNPKDMALSLMLEASEVVELTQWKNGDELTRALHERREDVGDELADVLYWVLLFAHDQGIDLEQAFQRKLEKNEKKYPVHLSKGTSLKYSDLPRRPDRNGEG